MDNFVAVDVETANRERSSICSIGAVKVKDGVVVDRKYSLICPEPEWYSRYNTAVHGLSEEDTWDAPNFGDVWADWQEWLEGLPLVAHNAQFDRGCIPAFMASTSRKSFSVPSKRHARQYPVACARRNHSTCCANFSEYRLTIITMPWTTPKHVPNLR